MKIRSSYFAGIRRDTPFQLIDSRLELTLPDRDRYAVGAKRRQLLRQTIENRLCFRKTTSALQQSEKSADNLDLVRKEAQCSAIRLFGGNVSS